MSSPNILLALDPSLRSSGVALFTDGALTAAATIRDTQSVTSCKGHRCASMGHEIVYWLQELGVTPTRFAFEWPQIYRASKSKGDPNDLPALVGVSMYVAGVIFCTDIHSYTPREWAGSLPKATTSKAAADASPRANRIRSHLSKAELKHWPTGQHDAIDSVGIGLHFLGRLKPARVFPGSTP